MTEPNDRTGLSAPRMNIRHLLAWTLATAAGIRAYQLIPPLLDDRFGYLPEVYVCVMGLALGTFVIGCTFLFLTHRVRNADWQPGHWMLMLGVASAISNCIGIGVLAACFVPENGFRIQHFHLAQFTMFGYYWLVHQSVAWGLGTMAAIGWFRQLRPRVTMPWTIVAFLFVAAAAIIFSGNLVALFRICFTVSTHSHPQLLASSPALDSWYTWWCFRSGSGHVFATCVVACSIAMLFAVIDDANHRLRRDWLHWMGIGTWVVIATMQLITFSVIHLTPLSSPGAANTSQQALCA